MGGVPSLSNKDDLSLPKLKLEEEEDELVPKRPLLGTRFCNIHPSFKFDVDDTSLSSKNLSKDRNYGVVPLNILHNIMLFQELSDLFSMSISCKLFQTIFNDNHFWKCYYFNIEKLHNKMFKEEEKEKKEEFFNDNNKQKNWKKKYFVEIIQSSESHYLKKYRRVEKVGGYQNYGEEQTHPRLKITTLGDYSSGKTSFVNRYVNNKFMEYEGTIGAAFLTVTLEYLAITHQEKKAKVQLEIWDYASEERYRSLAPMYYRGSDGAMVFFGIDSLKQFEQAKSWVLELKTHVFSAMNFVLVGTKSDLEEKREVFYEKHVQEFVQEQKLAYVEVSSKYGKNHHKAIGLTVDCAIENSLLKRM